MAPGLAVIVVATPLQVTAENIWNAISGDDSQIASLSLDSQQQIKAVFEQVIAEKIAEKEKDRFATAISREPRILGIGVSRAPEIRPTTIVPRDALQAYLGGKGLRAHASSYIADQITYGQG